MNREKVIKGIHQHCEGSLFDRCGECPYYEIDFSAWEESKFKCRDELLSDALDLLKEQEAVEPKQVDLYGKEEWYGFVCRCPDCKALWMTSKADTHFCPNCGQAVKWE